MTNARKLGFHLKCTFNKLPGAKPHKFIALKRVSLLNMCAEKVLFTVVLKHKLRKRYTAFPIYVITKSAVVVWHRS